MFYKTLFKRNYKEISAHLPDRHFECCIFNIVQHRSTSSNICDQRLEQRGFASLAWKQMNVLQNLALPFSQVLRANVFQAIRVKQLYLLLLWSLST